MKVNTTNTSLILYKVNNLLSKWIVLRRKDDFNNYSRTTGETWDSFKQTGMNSHSSGPPYFKVWDHRMLKEESCHRPHLI